jgi:hypothetical protein
MIDNKQQTAVEWYIEKLLDLDYEYAKGLITLGVWSERKNCLIQQAKEMEKKQMRLDIEKKWEQYRIITNNEDAWSFKEWLIKQTYGGGEQ